ncbi:MAG: hypothetical protein IJ053_00210, partial [Lachnospiraceae bacterium]|nr:hypothetical protein [Lachnospiraceae bacterium]
MRIMKKVVALSLCTALVFTSDLGLSTSKAVELDETTEVVTEESVGTDMYEIDETEDFDSDISVQLDDIDVEDTEVSDDMEDVYDEDIEVIEQIDETADIQDIIEEDNIYGSTYMDEAVPLSFNTTVSYKFDKGISQRRVYKITASKDAIISWKGKAYADSDDTDKITINLYNEDGEELIDKTCYIYTNEGFESFEGYYCVTKGNYYLMFSNCDNYSLGEYFSYIGTDSISFTANLEYPSSTEKENNDNFNK